MKRTLYIVLVVALLGPIAATAQPQPSACYNIPNSDARSYCIAVARRDPSQCYNIQRSDLRQQCLAEAGR